MRNQDRSETVTYFIDGTNLCYWQDTSRPTIHVLLELLIALKKEKNRSFYCIFDANTQYKLPPEERETYQHLLEFKDYFYQITGGKRADDFILELANSYDAPVISNDTYSDPKYAKYSWKERDFTPKRLFMGEVIPLRGDIHLIISELDLHVWLQDTVHNTFKRFVRMIQPASSRFRGRVKFFNRQEGWGLIAYETDIYFHRAALLETVDEGMEVEFVTGSNDKGICAEQIISGVNKRDGKPLVSGVVENYDEIKTIGSIKVNETGEMLFFYKSYIEDGVTITLQKGMNVEFTVGTNKNGACARNIRPAVIDENKYFNDKIAQLETLLKEKETIIREKDILVKEKEGNIVQIRKQYEQGIQTANTARNVAEKALRQLQATLANNDNARFAENGKQNAANGQNQLINNGNGKHNNNGQQGNNGTNNGANNENANTNGTTNLPVKETELSPPPKETVEKQQPVTNKKGDNQQEHVQHNKQERNNAKLPEKQQQVVKQFTAQKPSNDLVTDVVEEDKKDAPEIVTQHPLVVPEETIVEQSVAPKIEANDANVEPQPIAPTNAVLPLDDVVVHAKGTKGKKATKDKKESTKTDKIPTTAGNTEKGKHKTAEKTPKEPHKTKSATAPISNEVQDDSKLIVVDSPAATDSPVIAEPPSTAPEPPVVVTTTATEVVNDMPPPAPVVDTAPPVVKQVITADYFDTPIKRKQWWASLQPQWKKAFNIWVGKGEITDVPDDEQLMQIFSTEKLSFKLAKHKLSFQLTNLSGVQYLTNLTSLNVSEQAISDLKGTEKLHKLIHFNGSKNKLASLDGIDVLVNIEELICSYNQLGASAFDNIATRLPRLRSLDCKHNLLTKEECAFLKRTGSIKDLKV